jgi:hypothetical protein
MPQRELKIGLIGLATVLAIAGAAPAHAVLIVSSEVSLEANAHIGFGDTLVAVNDLDSASKSDTIDPLSASVSAIATMGETRKYLGCRHEKARWNAGWRLEPVRGLEPPTNCLQGSRSTN